MKFGDDKTWEAYKKRLNESFSLEDEYVICGMGNAYLDLRKLYPTLKTKFFVDTKWEEKRAEYGLKNIYGFDYLPTLPPEERCKLKFLVTPGQEQAGEIKSKLIGGGVSNDQIITTDELNFFFQKRYHNRIFIDSCVIEILTRCTLKCKGCIQYRDYPTEDYYDSLEEAKDDITSFFEIVSYCREFNIVGGETFLYKEFDRVIDYVCENFIEQIGKFETFTNATVLPEPKIWEAMQRAGIKIHISDYGLKEQKIDEFLQLCERYHVAYHHNRTFGASSHDLWFDVGDPYVERPEAELVHKFLNCSSRCPAYAKGKYFGCSVTFGMEAKKIHELPKDNDYILFRELKDCSQEERFDRIGAFRYGFVEQGYYEGCRYCNGFGKELNTQMIPAGMQIE